MGRHDPAQHVLSTMMHDLDEMAAKTDWKTPMSKSRLNSLLEEASTVEPGDAVPPIHRWLSEVCREPDDSSAVSNLLSFPSSP